MALILILAFVLTASVLVQCEESPTGLVDVSPLLSSGKRQHSIMRFGKRPSTGHSLIHFGKRGEDPQQHRFLFLGKREEPYHYLQGEDSSYKRGHTIMRFGKRDGSHNFMRFGRGEEDEKRADGHNMMYFGKRGGHSMMYFGKRDSDYDLYPEDMLEEEKKAHSMIHFGKREEDDLKRASSHSMIHFGKRLTHDEDTDGTLPVFWSPEMLEKRNHNLLRFGKKTEGPRARGSHAMIHFGKRSVAANQSEAVVTRTKREEEEEEESPLIWDEEEMEYSYPEKKESAKNAFLRFG